MNSPSPSPSPLVPQGSLLEQKNKGRSRVKFAFFCVVGVHVAALMVALLSQGCKREQTGLTDATSQPLTDTNLPVLLPETNTAYVAPSNVPPPPVPDTTLATPSTQQEYVIQRGDSYSTIAKKYPGVTVKAIHDANPGVDPLKLQPGKKIVIPAAAAAAATPGATGATPAVVTGEQVYVVKSGDTLTTIASHHGTTVKALRAANSLTTDKIKVGQKLKIPVKATPPAETVPTAPPPAR
jgi:LysM repeat protein